MSGAPTFAMQAAATNSRDYVVSVRARKGACFSRVGVGSTLCALPEWAPMRASHDAVTVMLALASALVSLTACQRGEHGVPPDATQTPEAAARIEEEACVDRWLEERDLDPYGSPRGTVYLREPPLFDESTGAMKSRVEYVYAKHPDACHVCRMSGLECES